MSEIFSAIFTRSLVILGSDNHVGNNYYNERI